MSRLASEMVDEVTPSVLARVALHDGETSHWERDPDTGDIHVSVVTHRFGSPLRPLLHGIGGGSTGIWSIPPIGAEVLVLFPDGDFEGDPVIFGGGVPPADLDGVTILIVAPAGGKVKIMQEGGAPERMPTMDDVESLRRFIINDMVIETPSGLSTPGLATATPTPPVLAGTTVLEAE